MDFLMNLDWAVLLKIIGIDLILGLDNAMVIALACATLSASVRNKAIMIGTAGAILARVLFLFIGFWLIGLPFVKLVAGAYLAYLGYSLLVTKEEDPDVKSGNSMWAAIGTIVLADVMMSLDNVIAVTSAASGTGDHGFGYAVFGIVLSIPIIIFASKFLVAIMDKFPIVIWGGAGLITWVGMEMLLKEQFIANIVGHGTLHTILMVGVTVATLSAAFLKNKSIESKGLTV